MKNFLIGLLLISNFVMPKDIFNTWLKEESVKQQAKRGEAATIVAKAAK